MRHGGNGAMRKLAAQKTRPHGAARNQQKPAAVRGTLNEQSPERSGGVVAIQPAAKYAGNGGRDSVPRPGVQTIERGGFGRSFRFRRPHCGAGNGPVPKWSHTCSDRHPKCPFRGEYSMHIVEVRRNGDGIAAEMNQMRGWLDAHRIEPQLFQLNGVVLRVGFDSGGEATVFADAFDGRVLSENDARAALRA